MMMKIILPILTIFTYKVKIKKNLFIYLYFEGKHGETNHNNYTYFVFDSSDKTIFYSFSLIL